MAFQETSTAQRLYLWCMCAVYFFAFSSLYFQIPGLYGRKGILPVVNELKPQCQDRDGRCADFKIQGECERNEDWMSRSCMVSCGVCKKGQELSLIQKFEAKKTLLWFSPDFGLDSESGMEFLCLLGTLFAFSGLIYGNLRNRFLFFTLWLFYFSVCQVGQIFLWFQWDSLLLEAGFITMCLAPNLPSRTPISKPHHNMVFWLIKWLLFRLMYASGVVKLTSECPEWWGLTALNWHYESQCIPTPLAWYAHQLPDWIQRLSVVATYVIEIGFPFLFFAPIRVWRLFAFYGQILLQVLIVLTGNYNFFNLLTMTLCISLLDDNHIYDMTPRWVKTWFKLQLTREVKKKRSTTVSYLLTTINWLFIITSTYCTVKLFRIRLGTNGDLTTEITFSKGQFSDAVKWLTEYSVYMGMASFFVCVLQQLYVVSNDHSVELKSKIWRTYNQAVAIFWNGGTAWLFGISLVSLTQIDQNVQNDLFPIVRYWYHSSSQFELTHSYGLFRSMTGVGGRPEIIIEGSDDLNNGTWQEYEFRYKPGNMSVALPFVAPHQPRLDWQMWFAALGSYQHNPWFINLIYKMLKNEKQVMNLLGRNPFKGKPPKFIRSRLYTYHYTMLSKETSGVMDALLRARRMKDWWRRDSAKEYTPPLSVNDHSLKIFLKQFGVWEKDLRKEKPSGRLYAFLRTLRKIAPLIRPSSFMRQGIYVTLLLRIFNVY